MRLVVQHFVWPRSLCHIHQVSRSDNRRCMQLIERIAHVCRAFLCFVDLTWITFLCWHQDNYIRLRQCHWNNPVEHGWINGINSLRPRRNEQHFADDIFKRIFFIENVWISIKIALKFVPKGPINNIPALVQIMAWRRSGDRPLSEPVMVSLPTHICVTRPQWVN